MRKKQKGGIIVLSNQTIEQNASIENVITYFLQNSTMELLTKDGAEGIILCVILNADVVSPFVKLNNDEDPFGNEIPVRQLVLKINILNSTNLTVLRKRTITTAIFDSQTERELDTFLKTFNGVESMVPTPFFYHKILKSEGDWETKINDLFKNNNLIKDMFTQVVNRVDEGIGLCFYEMIENAQTVHDYIKPTPALKNETFVKIFAKMIFMLEKGIIHGDHHKSNILVDDKHNIQFIDFARSHVVVLSQEIIDAIELIKTSDDELAVSLAVIRCLRFIYDSGFYFNGVINHFEKALNIYTYIKKTIFISRAHEHPNTLADITNSELAIEVCRLVREEHAKQDIMSQHFLSNVVIGPSLINCEVNRRLETATTAELIASIASIKSIITEFDLPMPNIHALTQQELVNLHKELIDNNENVKQQIFESCENTTTVVFSKELIDVFRRKIFESTETRGGGASSEGNLGGAKTKRTNKKRTNKKRNNRKTKHRKLVGGGVLFNDNVFNIPNAESSKNFSRFLTDNDSNPSKQLISPIKTPIKPHNAASISPDNWISHYYKMDFAKTQETIVGCFTQHNYFAGIIIILIKLGVIGNNAPSIILQTEKAKTIINNAVAYYKKIDIIMFGKRKAL